MRTIEQLKAEAISIGLQDHQIGSYVIDQQKADRDERAAARELEREKAAAEQAKAATEQAKIEAHKVVEQTKINAQLAVEKEKINATERSKDREHERDMAVLRSNNQTQSQNVESASLPRLPLLHDGDDLTSYFVMFERIADMLKLDEDSYAVRLGTLLTGKARDIYASLPVDTIKDYSLLKLALLNGFHKTPDAYRLEFRSRKLSPGETYEQFLTHLGRCFDNWVRSFNVEQSYESLREFILFDQFMASIPPEIRLFILAN